jgi:hypothetical protein
MLYGQNIEILVVFREWYIYFFPPLCSNGLANNPHFMGIQACCLHCVRFACDVYSVITGVYYKYTDHAVSP